MQTPLYNLDQGRAREPSLPKSATDPDPVPNHVDATCGSDGTTCHFNPRYSTPPGRCLSRRPTVTGSALIEKLRPTGPHRVVHQVQQPAAKVSSVRQAPTVVDSQLKRPLHQTIRR